MIIAIDESTEAGQKWDANLKIALKPKYQQKPTAEVLDVIIEVLQGLRDNAEVKDNFAGRKGLN